MVSNTKTKHDDPRLQRVQSLSDVRSIAPVEYGKADHVVYLDTKHVDMDGHVEAVEARGFEVTAIDSHGTNGYQRLQIRGAGFECPECGERAVTYENANESRCVACEAAVPNAHLTTRRTASVESDDPYEVAEVLKQHDGIHDVRACERRITAAHAPAEDHVELLPESVKEWIDSAIEDTLWQPEYTDPGRSAESHSWSGGVHHNPILSPANQPAGYELQYHLVR